MQQAIQTLTSSFATKVTISGSKSITNRALLLAALAQGKSFLQNVLFADDTMAMIIALRSLGIKIEINIQEKTCLIEGCGGEFPNKNAKIFCNDAGTVARFIIPVCASMYGSYFFDGATRLRQRPLTPLLNILQTQGSIIDAMTMPLHLKADGLTGGEINIPGNQTSQFVSGLLLAAPFAKNTMHIVTKDMVSAPYVKMTCAMMKTFGVEVEKNNGNFVVNNQQQYQACNYNIETDISTASYFLAAAAITQSRITLPNIQETSLQADIEFITTLKEMGCEIYFDNNSLSLQGPIQLQGIDVCMRDFSDTFMTLAAIAPFANTPTTITGIRHTRLQESNRIAAMQDCLTKLKIKTESGEDWLRIYPGKPLGAHLSSHHDHRIAMACAVIGLRVPNLVIENAECVTKTCPEFFMLFNFENSCYA